MRELVVISNSIPPVNGVSIITDLIINALTNSGVKVYHIRTNTSSKFEDYNYQGKLSFRKILIGLIISIKGISLLILKRRVTHVYMVPGESFFGFMRFAIFIYLSKLLHKQIFLHFHGAIFVENFKLLSTKKRKIINKYLKKTSRIILLGDTYLQIYQNLFPDLKEKFVICNNAVSDKIILNKKEIESKIDRKPQKINILFLSNLIKTKGIFDLFESISFLKEKGFPFIIHICGAIEPSIKNEIIDLIDRYKGYVKYHGIVQGEIKKAILLESNIFCLPTYMPSEAQPISILEAMAFGNVIVTTNQGGIRDIFKNNINGYECEKMNPKSIAQAINNSIINLKEIACNNFIEYELKYSEKSFINRLTSILFGQNV